jgi:hypothetical protein
MKSEQRFLHDGSAEYKLWHPEVGALGRIRLIPAVGGGCVVRHDVCSANDGLNERRMQMLSDVAALNLDAFRRGTPSDTSRLH